MKTSGNTVLITGGATGIGFALAETLLDEGNEVIICGRRRSRLEAARDRHPALRTRVADVSRTSGRTALVAWLLRRFPNLNVLVNNAGVQRAIDFRHGSRDLALADEELATNLGAPIHLSAMLIPHLRRRREAAIVNISSGLGFTPLAVVPVYCATKAAVHAFSLSLRHQLKQTRVKVFEVAPPIVPTELSGDRERPDEAEFTMTPQAVAQGIVTALRRDRYEVALGAAANLHRKRDKLFHVIND